MPITRRDFLNGSAITLAAGLTPFKLSYAAMTAENARYYPPALMGMRGNHPGSFEMAHKIGREGLIPAVKQLSAEEHYDLVIVGAGLSGLASALFWQQKMGKDQRILLLDNHDDFGGHAKRNEFSTPEGTIIGYGGSESFQSPTHIYSPVVLALLKSLNVDIQQMAKDFDVNFYPDLNLSRGVYFDKAHFGEDKLVSGDPDGVVADDIPPNRRNGRPITDYINDFPLSSDDRQALILLHTLPKDYLAGMEIQQKVDWLAKNSYLTFLKDKVGLSQTAIAYFQQMTNDFQAVGIDATACNDAQLCGLPGFDAMGLPPLDPEDQAELTDPYIYHFPDGNAGLARIMVRRLIPAVAPGDTMHDCVTATFDYSQLDREDHSVRLRLNSTVVNVTNQDNVAEVSYFEQGELHKVSASKVVMACYNMIIPWLMPELPQAQKAALHQNVKAPLVYCNVVIRQWRAFQKLGVHDVYSPAAPFSMVKLDFPVDMGEYRHPRDPNKPICLHMVHVPTLAGSGLSNREQSRKGRAWLLGTPFSPFETMIREQLQGMLGEAGFDHQQDILGITVNRWAHGYSYIVNTLYDDEEEAEKTIKTARQPFGHVVIANSDSDWSPYAHAAIDQAWRAVDELTAPQGATS
ncbi:NAD(P)-binding protein [Rosenbergiella epipactidis]|uniref:NAD(P)-binding protein n=1 Tax=Rosenbergiella epipactidis TaxID=1544694 RepID=UPI001F4D38CC|nr:FAD/NAD(P)-binding protein [Rosenbergiella epipactidis]